MRLKSALLTLLTSLLVSGCSYKLVEKEQLDTVNTRLKHLEKNITQQLHKELDEKLTTHLKKMNEHEQQIEKMLVNYLLEQNQTIHALNTKLTALTLSQQKTKPKERKKLTTLRKTAPKDVKKLVVGSVERVKIYPSNLIMNARIDTGAETSSINANNITEFERDGKKWVRFTLFDEKTNTPYPMERRVVRRVRILQSSLEEGYERRVVVKLKITIGDREELSEFTLTSREHMQYPILIGRNVLQDLIVVDVSDEYMAPLVANQDTKFVK